MNIFKNLIDFFYGQQTYLGSHVLYSSGYKNTVKHLLKSYSEKKDHVSSFEILNVSFWTDLFEEINFELLHFKAKEIMCAYTYTPFTAENVAYFFEKHMNFGEDYVLFTLHCIQCSLKSNNGKKPHFSQKNFLAVRSGFDEREMLNKMLVMMQICVNFIESQNHTTRYLVESAPLYLRGKIGLPAIGSPFNISLLMGEQLNTYGFYLGNYHCSAIRAYMNDHLENMGEIAYA